VNQSLQRRPYRFLNVGVTDAPITKFSQLSGDAFKENYRRPHTA
jgi:hypothetical protein